jgi:polynucleotide 5'-kinase involved in rRNA processing
MNASQQNSIDLHNKIKDLYQLIGEGHNRIGDQREERAILILGETGAGKSTLTYLFAEKDLEARLNEEGVFIIEAKE